MEWTITFDPAKPEQALRDRGLDFRDAGLVFEANEREIKAYRQQFEEG